MRAKLVALCMTAAAVMPLHPAEARQVTVDFTRQVFVGHGVYVCSSNDDLKARERGAGGECYLLKGGVEVDVVDTSDFTGSEMHCLVRPKGLPADLWINAADLQNTP